MRFRPLRASLHFSSRIVVVYQRPRDTVPTNLISYCETLVQAWRALAVAAVQATAA
jgi:hypothetical protein